MARREFKCASLPYIDDGRIAEAFDRAVGRMAADCHDRPGDDRPRVIALEVQISPKLDSAGLYERADMELFLKEKIPHRRSKIIVMQPVRQNRFAFNDSAEDDPLQRTIDEMTGE